jgi:hypothetical protein
MQSQSCTVKLNARLMPLDRGAMFEDPLDDELKQRNLGEVAGGGTGLFESGEVRFCDVEINLANTSEETISWLIQLLELRGAPKGSTLHLGTKEIPLGVTEGLALYLNGSDLPSEVYENSDVNFVYEELDRLTEGVGMVFSYWEGPTETALYLYGSSFQALESKIQPLISTYPLCQKCRIVQIA